MTQPPTGRPDFQPSGRPDFAPAAPAPQAPPAPQPQAGFSPQCQLGQQQPQRATFQPEPPAPSGGKGRRPLLLGGIGILVVALLVLGWAFLFGPLSGDEPGAGTSEPPAVTGEGKLPQTPKIEAPAVIDEVAAEAGLMCHDEATTGIQVRGCYGEGKDHATVLRFLITDNGRIDSLFASVLDVEAEGDARAAELLTMLTPLLGDLPLADADRSAITELIGGTTTAEVEVDGDTAWGDEKGSYNYSSDGSVTALNLGRYSTTVMAPIPLSDSPDAVLAVLEESGWTCDRDDYTYDCLGQGIGNIAGSIAELEDGSQELSTFRVWFDPRPPAPTEPLMIDAYYALAAAGPKGEAMGIGLRKLAEGDERFFNSDAGFYRGESYYEIAGVKFN